MSPEVFTTIVPFWFAVVVLLGAFTPKKGEGAVKGAAYFLAELAGFGNYDWSTKVKK